LLHAAAFKVYPADSQFMLYQRLFEMDYDKHTGHYRVLDSFAPEVSER
jgi:hypothetical protein